MRRLDLLTYEEFEPKRKNQLFACSKNRIKYHNLRATEFRNKVAYFNQPLQNNIKILDELMWGVEDAIIHKEFLLGKGFVFEVFSHMYPFEGKNHFAVHHYLIIPLADQKIRIVCYQE
jgi:hypothetical protein